MGILGGLDHGGANVANTGELGKLRRIYLNRDNSCGYIAPILSTLSDTDLAALKFAK